MYDHHHITEFPSKKPEKERKRKKNLLIRCQHFWCSHRRLDFTAPCLSYNLACAALMVLSPYSHLSKISLFSSELQLQLATPTGFLSFSFHLSPRCVWNSFNFTLSYTHTIHQHLRINRNKKETVSESGFERWDSSSDAAIMTSLHSIRGQRLQLTLTLGLISFVQIIGNV